MVAAAVALAWFGTVFTINYERNKTVRQLEHSKARILAARGEEALQRDGATRALLIALAGLNGATTYVPELERLAYRSLQDLREQQIFSVTSQFAASEFSPDGETLLLMDRNQMKFWSVKEDRLIALASIPGFSAFIRPRWSDDGDWIIAGSGDGRTVLFAPCKEPALRRLFTQCEGTTEDVVRVIGSGEPSWPSVLSRDGSFLLSGGFGAPPKLWDLRRPNPEPVKLQDGPAGFAVAFHPHRNLAAIGAIDGSVRVHDRERPETPMHVLTMQKVKSVGATCSNASSAPEPAALQAKTAYLEVPVSSISFHPAHPELLAATSNDGTVRVWNFVSGQVMCQLSIKAPGFTTATFNSTGSLIAITSEDGPLVWALDTDQVLTLHGHRRSTWMVDFRQVTSLQSDNILVSASSDSTRIWRMHAALQATALDPQEAERARGLITRGDEKARIYNQARREYVDFKIPPDSLVAASPNGTRVLVARQTGDLKLGSLMLYHSASAAEPIAIFQAPIEEWKSIGFLTDPDRVVAVSAAGAAFSWRYFQDVQSLIKFAVDHLPLQDSQAVALSTDDQCRLGIRPAAQCQELYALQGTNRARLF
jgi:WD40 repeat protein